MTKLIINSLTIFFVLFIACNHKDDNTEYNDLLERELNSGIRKDTILLGYTFGMTKNQFEAKSENLIKKGILDFEKSILPDKFPDSWSYEIENPYDSLSNIELVFSPHYFQNKLYKVSASAWRKTEAGLSEGGDALREILRFFYEKEYGYADIKTVDTTQFGIHTRYIFIQGNREIEISGLNGGVLITYTDLLAKRELEKLENERIDEALKNTNYDL